MSNVNDRHQRSKRRRIHENRRRSHDNIVERFVETLISKASSNESTKTTATGSNDSQSLITTPVAPSTTNANDTNASPLPTPPPIQDPTPSIVTNVKTKETEENEEEEGTNNEEDTEAPPPQQPDLVFCDGEYMDDHAIIGLPRSAIPFDWF